MPHVRDVHDGLYLKPVVIQRAAQRIHKNISAHIAYMRIIVNSRSAGIHTHRFAYGCKRLFLSCKRVVNF